MTPDQFPRRRPSWWPENQPWPPTHRRFERGRFFRRVGCLFGVVGLLTVIGCATLFGLLFNVLGLNNLPEGSTAIVRGLIVIVIIGVVFSAVVAGRALRHATGPIADVMEAASKVPGPGPDFFYSPGQGGFTSAITSGTFTFTGTYLTQSYPLPAGSSVTLTGVFQAQPGFAAGSTLVHVSGQALDASFTGQSFAATAAVAAVPEPEAWLMLLGGLGLVAARVRRRSA